MMTICLFTFAQLCSLLLVNGFVNDILRDVCPSISEALLQVAGVMNWCLVCTRYQFMTPFCFSSELVDATCIPAFAGKLTTLLCIVAYQSL